MPRKKKEIKETKVKQEGLIKPRKTPKPKKKTLLEMQMADGKVYNKRGVKSLDELLHISSGKYNLAEHPNTQTYEQYLNGMNVSDLQAHAVKVGVLPNNDRSILVKRLLKEYNLNNSQSSATALAPVTFSKKIKQETIDILSQGR